MVWNWESGKDPTSSSFSLHLLQLQSMFNDRDSSSITSVVLVNNQQCHRLLQNREPFQPGMVCIRTKPRYESLFLRLL